MRLARLARAGAALLLCALPALLAWPARAEARVLRFAVIAGNDQGRASEQPLRYAASDAQKVYDVLRDLGEFEPLHMVLLRNETAATFRKTLIALNDRIRAAASDPNDQALLFVYYSGHADDEQLHLGGTDFAVDELAQLVRGSAATFRLLVLDACRSGALTRVKGGTIAAPFPIANESARLGGQGIAFITASSATEDAQESDELQGSLFTHALVSGLAGAADRDDDGQVVLEEAYRYAYDGTLRLTSRTQGGLQHATFQYDYRGQGELVLTRPRALRGRRGLLHLPPNAGFLVMRGREGGPVLAELGPYDVSRTLSLPAGRYYVLGRGSDHLLEGEVEVHADASVALGLSDFSRIEYARLVRKGEGSRSAAQSVEVGARARTPLPNGSRPCPGAFVGYGIDLEDLSVLARIGGCLSAFSTATVEASSDEVDLELRALHAWDLPVVTLQLGAGAGAALFSQRYETAGRAPSRTSLALVLHVALGARFDVGHGFYAAADAAAQTYLFELASTETGRKELATPLALRAGIGLGRQF